VSDQPEHPSRRRFLGDAIALGAGSLVLPPAFAHASTPARAATDGDVDALASFVPEPPARVYVDHDGSARLIEAARQGARHTTPQGAVVTFHDGGAAGLTVKVSAPATTLARVVLRWPTTRYR
jgi:hypothetical protein